MDRARAVNPADGGQTPIGNPADGARLRDIIERQFGLVWRSLRRLGVTAEALDDAAQQVWIVVARKLETIQPEHERAFVFSTAMRIASEHRRARLRRREEPFARAPEPFDPRPAADEVLDESRARNLLDRALDELVPELRSIFVLFELEQMSSIDIAALVGVPVGTVASRLRRARQEFMKATKRIRAKLAHDGDER